jgi:hypothetical protein
MLTDAESDAVLEQLEASNQPAYRDHLENIEHSQLPSCHLSHVVESPASVEIILVSLL